MWETERGAYKVSEGKPDRKIPFGRPRSRRKDVIKMNLQEVGWDKI